jgi:hypothetical protein
VCSTLTRLEGLVLYEPHYTNKEDRQVGQPIYRSFIPVARPGSKELEETYYTGEVLRHQGRGLRFCPQCRQHSFCTRHSFGQSLRYYMERVCRDESMLKLAPYKPLTMLAPIFLTVASQWMVVDQWHTRWVQDYESQLYGEGESHSLLHLNTMLRLSFMRRRSITIYQQLIQEAISHCARIRSPTTGSVQHSSKAGIGADLVLDFQFVLDSMTKTQRRIERNLDLIMNLINLRAAKEAGNLNKYAAIFLPLTTLISFFSISNRYGLGGDLLQHVTLPVTLSVTTSVAMILILWPTILNRYIWTAVRHARDSIVRLSTSLHLLREQHKESTRRKSKQDRATEKEVKHNKMRQGKITMPRLSQLKNEPVSFHTGLDV